MDFDEAIDEEVKRIIKRMRETKVGDTNIPIFLTLYGQMIDMDNPKHVLVSAYWMGYSDGAGRPFGGNKNA